MLWTNIKRVMRAGFLGFWRNRFVSLASVLVLTVTLSVIGGMVFLLATLDASLSELKSRVDINVYFQTTAPETDILSLQKTISALPEVKEAIYISREQSLENFRSRHQSDALTLQALAELPENPLGAVLNIRANDPSQYEGIAQFLKGDLPAQAGTALGNGKREIIDEVNYYDNKTAIDKLSRIIASAQTLGFGIALILAIVSVIIAFNTVRLAIYISREEISVMRLVGASNKYIRSPFVITGILYGAAAGFITLALLYPVTYYLGDATENFFSGLNLFRYYLAHFGEFFIIIAGSGVVLGAVSSFLAVRRYLNV